MRVFVALLVPVLLLVPAAADAYSMTAAIETQTRGLLDCGNMARGQEGTQVLLGVGHELSVPTPADPGVDMPVGPADVRPFTVIKSLDRCSPLLFEAMVSGEALPRVEIRLFDNRGVHFFTIRLERVAVTRMAMKVRERGLHEEVAFAFRVIHLIDELSGISASHDFAG